MNDSLRPVQTVAAALFLFLLSLAVPPMLSAAELTNPIPQSIPPGNLIGLEPVASGLTAPTTATNAPGDNGRLFVADQAGILWAIDLTSGEKAVFADLQALLVPLGVGGPDTYDERGFLGLAFHPDYQNNGLVYTYTSEPATGEPDFPVPFDANANHHSVISEWRVPNPQNPASVVDPGSRRVVLRIGQPQFNHNGGTIAFGNDAMLYVSLGDGGAADDQGAGHSSVGNAQDVSNVLGKILRIDPRGTSAANGQYGIPLDNPFVSTETPPSGGAEGCADGACDEIYAWGFRNPFRLSFDAATGDMYVADVGQNDIEEVSVVMAGQNYGWPIKEGSFCFDQNGTNPGFVTDDNPCPNQPSGLVDPIAEYDHDEGEAVVGGFVYRGTDVPILSGRYVFGDYIRSDTASEGRLFALDKANLVQNGSAQTSSISELRVYGQSGVGLSVLGFGEDARRELYLLGNTTGVPFGTTGVVMRITSLSSVQQKRNYRARLTGAEQVPAPINTPALGQALLNLSNDGTTLEVLVMVTRITDVVGAHIHLAPAGSNGPIVASFIPETSQFISSGALIPDSQAINVTGVLVRGTITGADLVGPLAGQQFKALIDAITAGNTYFNVHTVVNKPGEIRGQIR